MFLPNGKVSAPWHRASSRPGWCTAERPGPTPDSRAVERGLVDEFMFLGVTSHCFQGSFFLENHQKPWEMWVFWKEPPECWLLVGWHAVGLLVCWFDLWVPPLRELGCLCLRVPFLGWVKGDTKRKQTTCPSEKKHVLDPNCGKAL